MKIGSVTARVTALPIFHRVAAVLVLVGIPCGCFVLFPAQAREYISSAVLSYSGPKEMGLPAVAQATEIFDDQALAGGVEHSGLSPNLFRGQESGSWRNNLTMSEPGSGQLRMTWRAPDPRQARGNLLQWVCA